MNIQKHVVDEGQEFQTVRHFLNLNQTLSQLSSLVRERSCLSQSVKSAIGGGYKVANPQRTKQPIQAQIMGNQICQQQETTCNNSAQACKMQQKAPMSVANITKTYVKRQRVSSQSLNIKEPVLRIPKFKVVDELSNKFAVRGNSVSNVSFFSHVIKEQNKVKAGQEDHSHFEADDEILQLRKLNRQHQKYGTQFKINLIKIEENIIQDEKKKAYDTWCIKVEGDEESEDYFGFGNDKIINFKNNNVRKLSHETALESDGDDSDLSPHDTSSFLGSRYNHNYFEIEKEPSISNLSDKFLATQQSCDIDSKSSRSCISVNHSSKDVRIRKVHKRKPFKV